MDQTRRVSSLLNGVREREKELDMLDRIIEQGVTSVITKVSEDHARELLACLKFVIDLERIGDLLLNCGKVWLALSISRRSNESSRKAPASIWRNSWLGWFFRTSTPTRVSIWHWSAWAQTRSTFCR